MGRKDTDATNDALGKGRALELGEIGDPGPIEKASETNFVKEADLELFMQDFLLIIVHPDGNDNAVEFPCVSVNGINQAFIRGKEQKVKRKYVEQLARTRVTKYTQKVNDPSRPENIQMQEGTALVYPFSVLHDPDPKGRAWLQAILAQPA